jgi:NAD(P)H-hydrate epimerase
MTLTITADAMRRLERDAIESGSVTGEALMERAGASVLDAIAATWPDDLGPETRVVVLCGPGNNGGDGFVVARRLAERGVTPTVFFYGDTDRLPPDARLNHDRWAEMGEVHPLSFPTVKGPEVAEVMRALSDGPRAIVVDALFGIGLTRPIQGLERLVEACQRAWGQSSSSGRVLHRVAVDLPSGLGERGPVGVGPLAVFDADLTVTFHAKKSAHAAGRSYCGQIVVQDIGLA